MWSNGVRVVENQYDALDRRVIKRTPEATHTFVYDGWLLVVERVERSSGILEQIDYWWGKDLSGKLDGAGGIGGLLYIVKNGCDVYVPLYDGHGVQRVIYGAPSKLNETSEMKGIHSDKKSTVR